MSGIPHASSTRIHAIVLTRDRPETLRRCVGHALRGLGRRDRLTILDDSSVFGRLSELGSEVLPHGRGATLFHLPSREVETVVCGSDGTQPTWLSRTAARDIAPLRNLSLLLSIAVSAETTLLIDDDVCQIDPVGTHRWLDMMAKPEEDLIVGATMTGISELDTITRLTEAMEGFLRSGSQTEKVSPRSLFQVPHMPPSVNPSECRYVSGGYLAFRIAGRKLFAFPPGYNEDWLWCSLHRNTGVRVIRSLESVAHAPPALRQPTAEDLSFELLGDLVFDCLDAQQPRPTDSPRDMLIALAARPPDPDWMPATRAKDLLDMANSESLRDKASILEPYGMSVLGKMLRVGELEWNGADVITSWSRDAVAKHNAFTATLRDEELISQVRTFIEDRKA